MPSTAGGSARADCLLKSENVIIEFKMTRDGYTADRLRKELADDFVVYPRHQDCKRIFAFAYDPMGRLRNPRGIEHDLSQPRPPITHVRTVIHPMV